MKFWQVDAFTDQPFKGNPAAVFILAKDINNHLKQKIAEEMNLSETVFVVLNQSIFEIQWFTPVKEVNLCGHATLAAAHILWEQNFVKIDKITFNSKSGVLHVSRNSNKYTLDFPQQPAIEKVEYYPQIAEIINLEPLFIGSNNEDCMVVVKERHDVESANPNLEKIKNLSERGLILTSRDKSQQFDYIYRAFFPKLNVPEDPVTGSANTILAPYWSKFYQSKKYLKAYQASLRQGILDIELYENRVYIIGQAVTVFEANLFYPFD